MSSHSGRLAGRPHRTVCLAAVLAVGFALLVPWPSAARPVNAASSRSGGATAAAPAALPTLVAIRAAHHAGYDRIVFEFDSSTVPTATVRRVTQIIADGSGHPVPVPGRSLLEVTFQGAQAHTSRGAPSAALDRAFALPNVVATRGAGDFEGVVTVGIGLAKKEPYKVIGLDHPGRLAIDVSTRFARTWRRVTLADVSSPHSAAAPGLVTVRRQVPDASPVTGLLDRILAGPTSSEHARGVRLVSSGVTGFTHVSVSGAIARVRLAGRCAATPRVTIASEVISTLRRLGSVRWVKISDSSGHTRFPTGNRDSVPACLS